MTIHLHLGAHKTASTHIQAIFRENAHRLTASGVRYASPAELRTLIGSGRSASARMGSIPSLRAELASRRLAKLAAEEPLLVLSDENSLGQCGEMIGRSELYPTASARLRIFRRLTQKRETKVFLAIRSYAPFFAGVHAQSIRRGGAEPLSGAQLGSLAELPRRWPDIVNDIRRTLPSTQIVLWRFEDYKALRTELPTLLSGVKDLKPFRRKSMATPSAEAMAAIFDLASSRADRAVTKGEYAHLRETLPGERYAPFGAGESARLRAAYQEDVATLKADLTISFLSPTDVP